MSPRPLDKEQFDARARELLTVALALIEQQGVAGLTMDKLVAHVPYSKGTVYNHYSSKEDLLTALCVEGMGILSDLFRRACAHQGNTRERTLAIHIGYLIYALLHPTQFLLVISAMSPATFEKTSDEMKEALRSAETLLFDSVVTIVNDAIHCGDLVLPGHMTVQQVAFSNWSTSFGTIALLAGHLNDCECRRGLHLDTTLFNNVNLLLDGLNWLPKSTQFNYSDSLKRISAEVFGDELQALNKMHIRFDFSPMPVPLGSTADLFG